MVTCLRCQSTVSLFINETKPGMDDPAINPSSWEVEGGGLWITVNPGIARSYVKQTNIFKGRDRKIMYIQMRQENHSYFRYSLINKKSKKVS